MLLSETLSPLDLYDLIDDTERLHGARGVVDLLVEVLIGPRVRDDADIDEYLPTLKSACRQSRRYRDIIPVLQRIAELNPTRRHEVAAHLAVVHGHLKEPMQGIALLKRAVAAHGRLRKAERSQQFFAVAEIAAAVLGQPALAHEVATAGRVAMLAPLRWRDEALFTLPMPAPGSSPALALAPDLVDAGRPRLSLILGEAA
jgi:hypothetical protein